jgi:hypothetical protein
LISENCTEIDFQPQKQDNTPRAPLAFARWFTHPAQVTHALHGTHLLPKCYGARTKIENLGLGNTRRSQLRKCFSAAKNKKTLLDRERPFTIWFAHPALATHALHGTQLHISATGPKYHGVRNKIENFGFGYLLISKSSKQLRR